MYQARDSQLHREVAIKVLPAAFENDSESVARLKREARVLASLSHPGITAIYGLEGNALVMELVPGHTG